MVVLRRIVKLERNDHCMNIHPALTIHSQSLLELTKPWKVTDIILNMGERRVNIIVEWLSGCMVKCLECGKRCTIKDHAKERAWRHVNTLLCKSYVHCCVVRSNRPIHELLTVIVPWAEPHTRRSIPLEMFALELLTCAMNSA